jgi:alpha-amylase/alpha-mannosidase (GH57 family)
MSSPRYVCIHGHFYQPPRENPWLDVVEVQDSAAPHHDWNERITRECYAPNVRSRLVDSQGSILGLINNYAWMSFNFGPTLLSWMADAAPEVLAGIVEADRLSRERRGGHGNAMAQVYNHIIMPLASEHDRRTQVRWGIADFRHRFGREPEGMWLAETAADVESLEALAEAGIRYTVLAPSQARRWRPLGAEAEAGAGDGSDPESESESDSDSETGCGSRDWYTSESGGIDPSRAYLCRLPSGRSIALFFYDGIVSRDVAFERLLDDGEKFLRRLLDGFDPSRQHAQLMHIATDGESYGHHHPHGDMALAYVLRELGRHPEVRLTNYGEFLALHPPEWEVEIHDRSAWSCAHGVERWNSDCGCKMRGDWHQQWRGPLRRAFDQLKEQLDHLFATRGRECFPDPWGARDAYIQVILDRSPRSVRQFLREHGHADLDPEQVRDALRLLEMQRHALYMYTSCGWFFDEISGLETTQCLHYAARAIHLAKEFGRDCEGRFVRILRTAPSNLPRFRTGRGVWEQLVQPAVVDLERVLAHSAISLIFPEADPDPHPHIHPHAPRRRDAFDVEVLSKDVHSRGSSHLATGHLRVRSRQTWDEAETFFAVIHYGGLDFFAVLLRDLGSREFDHLRQRLRDAYKRGSLADVTTLLTREFPGNVHRLDDLFVDEQRRIIGIVLRDRIEDYRQTFERLFTQDEDMLNRLGQMHYPIPKPLGGAASASLDLHLKQAIARVEQDGDPTLVRTLCERGSTWGYQPQRDLLAQSVAESLRRTIARLDPEADLAALANLAEQLLDAASLLGVEPDLWQAQNLLLDASVRLTDLGVLDPEIHAVLARLAGKLKLSPDLLGWRP